MNNLTNKQQLELAFRPVLYAISLTVIMLLTRPYLNPLISGDEGAMTSGAIAFFGTLYAIVGGFSIFEALRQFNTVWDAYITHNKNLYDANIDKRLPGHLKVAWFGISLFLIGSFVLTYWHNPLTATFVVFSITLCVSYFWQVGMDLDEYHTGYWNIPAVNESWWDNK